MVGIIEGLIAVGLMIGIPIGIYYIIKALIEWGIEQYKQWYESTDFYWRRLAERMEREEKAARERWTRAITDHNRKEVQRVRRTI